MKTIRDVFSPEQAAPVVAYKASIERALPGRIARVILFGSRARGDARTDSDYDVAVFVRDMGDRRAVRAALSDAAYDFVLQGIYIRPMPFPESDLDAQPQSELAGNILRDGVLVQ